VLALPEALTVAAALERVRDRPESARYNLYVIDAEQRLVGTLNLRELLLASPERALRDVMVPRPFHLRADADRAEVLGHPGWREVHALPVVDSARRYLGALRYRTLRELEDELRRRASADATPARALGELLALGAAGALDALGGAALRGERADGR
jgi:magnesium transporter